MKERVRRLLAAGLVVTAMAVMSGCGAAQQEVESSILSNEAGVVYDGADAEANVETENTETVESTEKVELAADFDEEFVITPGETLYIGREDVSITLKRADYDDTYEYDYTYIVYDLKIGDKVYEGSGNWNEKLGGGAPVQEEFTENRVRFISADEDKSVTMMITSGTEVKAPLVLSGKAEDEYVTTEPEYVEAEEMILFLDEGVKVYGNTIELIETIFGLVEKETGLSFDSDYVFTTYRDNDIPWLFDDEVFAGVDPDMEKIHIYVVPYEKSIACCGVHSIIINPEDLEIAAGDGATVVHELTHLVQRFNGVGMDRILDEGYASYISGRVSDKDEQIVFHFDADSNYSYFPVEITAKNAETQYINGYEEDWYHYLYGYWFVNYLFETYGEDVYREILADATAGAGQWVNDIDAATMVPIIKENTSEDVFEKFAEWLKKNQARFE